MAQICEFFGISSLQGNRVSHANNKTKHRQYPNLKKKKYFIPELSRSVTLTLSSRAIRSIDKLGGISPALLNARDDQLSDRVAKLKTQIKKS